MTALDALVRDTRYGVRRLARDWRFTAAAVLILALAIGANTAIFSVVNAALFREQRVTDPGRLVRIAGVPVTIVGVGPANHRATIDVGVGTDFWLPITALPAIAAVNAPAVPRATATIRAPLLVKARLRADATVPRARAAMDV